MAINPLNEDLNIISGLVIPGLDVDMDNIQKLDDEPNDVGGLSAQEFKREFDRAGNTIKDYINDTLLPAISDTYAEAAVRAEAEAQRVENEEGRVSAEGDRVIAENNRASAETERQTAESDRDTAEGGRSTAEAARVLAETARAGAETERAGAEENRVAAESARVLAESGRAAAETARETAEGNRAAAELARDAAERQRADETAGIVTQATAQAQAAALSAQNAGQSATSASESAGQASAYSTTAAQSAAAAAGSESAALQSKQSAALDASAANAAALLATSYAVGGTGTRPGEDTDNAKYYKEQAAAIVGGDYATRDEAQGYADAAQAAAEATAAADATAKANAAEAAANAASVPRSWRGTANGVASLDENGIVPSEQLPDMSTGVLVTITAAGWSNTHPYTQTVSVEGLLSDSNGDINIAQTATEAQRTAARNAMIGVTGQAAGSLTLVADGEKPTVSIPALVTIFA